MSDPGDEELDFDQLDRLNDETFGEECEFL